MAASLGQGGFTSSLRALYPSVNVRCRRTQDKPQILAQKVL